ncbi:hypothetical protein [Nocardia gamkensis]|uniref:hypothetical protein n=1 Tax=Nocardia gamkensis TaxID=352869 RepID=UPI0037CCB3F1
MTRDVPSGGLPPRRPVDDVIQVNESGSQDRNQINVGTNSGVIGQGAGSIQFQHVGGSHSDLAAVIAQLRAAIPKIADETDRSDAEQTVDDFETAASGPDAERPLVQSRWRAVQRLAASVGGAFATAAGSEAAQATVEAINTAM